MIDTPEMKIKTNEAQNCGRGRVGRQLRLAIDASNKGNSSEESVCVVLVLCGLFKNIISFNPFTPKSDTYRFYSV